MDSHARATELRKEFPGLHPGLHDLIRVLAKQAHCASRTLIVCEPVCYSKNYPESKYHKNCKSPKKGRSWDSLCRPSSLWSPIRPESYYYDCFSYRQYPDRDSEYREIEKKYNLIKQERLDYSPPECDEDKIQAIDSGASRGKMSQMNTDDSKASDGKSAGGGKRDDGLKGSIRFQRDDGLKESSSSTTRDSHHDPNDLKEESSKRTASNQLPQSSSKRNMLSDGDSVPCAELAEIRDLLKESDRETIKRLQEMLILMKELSVRDICRARCDSPSGRSQERPKTTKGEEEVYLSGESDTAIGQGTRSARKKDNSDYGFQESQKFYPQRNDDFGYKDSVRSNMRDGLYEPGLIEGYEKTNDDTGPLKPMKSLKQKDDDFAQQGSLKSFDLKLGSDEQDSKINYHEPRDREYGSQESTKSLKQANDDGPEGLKKRYMQKDDDFGYGGSIRSFHERDGYHELQGSTRSYQLRDGDGSQGSTKIIKQIGDDGTQEDKRNYNKRKDGDYGPAESMKSSKQADEDGPEGRKNGYIQRDDDFGSGGSIRSFHQIDSYHEPHGSKRSYQLRDGNGSQGSTKIVNKLISDGNGPQEAKRNNYKPKDDDYGPQESMKTLEHVDVNEGPQESTYNKSRDAYYEPQGSIKNKQNDSVIVHHGPAQSYKQRANVIGPQGSKTSFKPIDKEFEPQGSTRSYQKKHQDDGQTGQLERYHQSGGQEELKETSQQSMSPPKRKLEEYDDRVISSKQYLGSERSYQKQKPSKKMKSDDEEKESITSLVGDQHRQGKKTVDRGEDSSDSDEDQVMVYARSQHDLNIAEPQSLQRHVDITRSTLGEESCTSTTDSEISRASQREKPPSKKEKVSSDPASDSESDISLIGLTSTESSNIDVSKPSKDRQTNPESSDTEPQLESAQNTPTSRSLTRYGDEPTSSSEEESSSSLTKTQSEDGSSSAMSKGQIFQKQSTVPPQDQPGSGANNKIPIGKKNVPLTIHEVVELSNKITDVIVLEVMDELIKCSLYFPPSRRRYLHEPDATMPSPSMRSQMKPRSSRQILNDPKPEAKDSSHYKNIGKVPQMKSSSWQKLNEHMSETKASSGFKDISEGPQTEQASPPSILSIVDESSSNAGLSKSLSRKLDSSTGSIDSKNVSSGKWRGSTRDTEPSETGKRGGSTRDTDSGRGPLRNQDGSTEYTDSSKSVKREGSSTRDTDTSKGTSRKKEGSIRATDPSESLKQGGSTQDTAPSRDPSRKKNGSTRHTDPSESVKQGGPTRDIDLSKVPSRKQDGSTRDIKQGKTLHSEEAKRSLCPRHSKSQSPTPPPQKSRSSCCRMETEPRAKFAGHAGNEVASSQRESSPPKPWERRLSSQMKAAWGHGRQNGTSPCKSPVRTSGQAPLKGPETERHAPRTQTTQPGSQMNTSGQEESQKEGALLAPTPAVTKPNTFIPPSKQAGQMAPRRYITSGVSGIPTTFPGSSLNVDDGNQRTTAGYESPPQDSSGIEGARAAPTSGEIRETGLLGALSTQKSKQPDRSIPSDITVSTGFNHTQEGRIDPNSNIHSGRQGMPTASTRSGLTNEEEAGKETDDRNRLVKTKALENLPTNVRPGENIAASTATPGMSQLSIVTGEPCEPCQPDNFIATDYDIDKSVLYYARITNNAFPPVKETYHAAGFMLRSAYDYEIAPRSKVNVKTDLLLLLPRNSYGRIAPRKCMVENYGIDVGADVIDRDYKGNITVVMFNHSDKSFSIHRGNKIAQLICESIHLAKIEENKTLLK